LRVRGNPVGAQSVGSEDGCVHTILTPGNSVTLP